MGKHREIEVKKSNIKTGATIIAAILFLSVFVLGNSAKDSEVDKKEVVNESSKLKIGFITDSHCYGKLLKDGNWEVNWRCAEPIDAFVRQMSGVFKPDVVVQGGDLCDGRDEACMNNLQFGKKLLEEIGEVPVFHVLGNHEAREIGKKEWLELFNYQKTYYAFDIRDFRIIVLDANYFPEALPEDDQKVIGAEINISPDSGDYYPGYVPNPQIEWLRLTLEQAQNKKKLVFIHHPPLERTTVRPRNRLLSNANELRDIFSDYGVTAVFSGHIEEFCQLEYEGVKYYVLQGVHKGNELLADRDQYKNAGVFSEILIEENSVLVKVYYSSDRGVSYQTFILNQETAVCNNQSTS